MFERRQAATFTPHSYRRPAKLQQKTRGVSHRGNAFAEPATRVADGIARARYGGADEHFNLSISLGALFASLAYCSIRSSVKNRGVTAVAMIFVCNFASSVQKEGFSRPGSDVRVHVGRLCGCLALAPSSCPQGVARCTSATCPVLLPTPYQTISIHISAPPSYANITRATTDKTKKQALHSSFALPKSKNIFMHQASRATPFYRTLSMSLYVEAITSYHRRNKPSTPPANGRVALPTLARKNNHRPCQKSCKKTLFKVRRNTRSALTLYDINTTFGEPPSPRKGKPAHSTSSYTYLSCMPTYAQNTFSFGKLIKA